MYFNYLQFEVSIPINYQILDPLRLWGEEEWKAPKEEKEISWDLLVLDTRYNFKREEKCDIHSRLV